MITGQLLRERNLPLLLELVAVKVPKVVHHQLPILLAVLAVVMAVITAMILREVLAVLVVLVVVRVGFMDLLELESQVKALLVVILLVEAAELALLVGLP